MSPRDAGECLKCLTDDAVALYGDEVWPAGVQAWIGALLAAYIQTSLMTEPDGGEAVRAMLLRMDHEQ